MGGWSFFDTNFLSGTFIFTCFWYTHEHDAQHQLHRLAVDFYFKNDVIDHQKTLMKTRN